MQDVLMDARMEEHAPFANRLTCQAFQRIGNEKRAKATPRESMTIEDSTLFSMWS